MKVKFQRNSLKEAVVPACLFGKRCMHATAHAWMPWGWKRIKHHVKSTRVTVNVRNMFRESMRLPYRRVILQRKCSPQKGTSPSTAQKCRRLRIIVLVTALHPDIQWTLLLVDAREVKEPPVATLKEGFHSFRFDRLAGYKWQPKFQVTLLFPSLSGRKVENIS